MSGTHLREHRTAGWVSIETVAGYVRVRVPERVVDLPTGHILVLDRKVPHDLEAIEESAFLLAVVAVEHAAEG